MFSLEEPSFESKLPLITIILITFITLSVQIWKYTVTVLPLRRKKLPPGKLGLPIIGESTSLIKAYKENKVTEWFEKRIAKYGLVFKTSLMGSNVIVITGQAGNKFVLSGSDNGIAAKQPASSAAILGKNNIFDLSGSRHKLMRGAMMSFLNHESIQKYVSEMDSLVQQELFQELKDKEYVKILPLMKKITFKITCSLLFGLPAGKEKDALFEDFKIALRGTWSVPLNFPGTVFRNALQARGRICKLFSQLIKTRKRDLSSQNDVISSLLALRDENGKLLPEEDIINNMMALMIASHDTITVVLCLFIRKLAKDANVYKKVLEEQNEVVNAREASGGKISWGEMQKMRYTWNVAQELMRITPPVFATFRHACRDTSFGGYDIPKGWQVLWVASGTHLDKKIFEEPEKFDPSRFEKCSKIIPPFTYVAFGAGQRICPGAEFARIEMLLIIHHLITTYRWTQVFKNEPMMLDPLPYPAKGLPIKISPLQKQINSH